MEIKKMNDENRRDLYTWGSPTIGQIAKALSLVQAALQNVKKEKSGYNYKYADLASCLDIIKEPFAMHGLSVSQLVETQGDEIALITILMHESGEWLKSTFPLKIEPVLKKDGSKAMNDMQALGSAISYARRYALSAITGLAQEDDDGHSSRTNYSKPHGLSQMDATTQTQLKEKAQILKKLCKESDIDILEFINFIQKNDMDINRSESIDQVVNNFNSLRYNFVLENTKARHLENTKARQVQVQEMEKGEAD